MNIRRIVHSKIFWGLGSRILNIAGSFIMLPVIVHYLDKEMLALYYLFASLVMLTSILDFGFNATLTRNFAYAYAGARGIQAEGVCLDFDSETNWVLVGEIFLLAKKIYRYISLLSLFVFFVPGSFYIYHVVKASHLSTNYALTCWLIFSSASVLAMYYLYLSTIIQGRGDVNLANKISVVSRVISIVISVTLLFRGYGLLSISISSLSVSIVERILYHHYTFRDAQHSKLKTLRSLSHDNFKKNLKLISVNSVKFGIVSLGAYLIMRSTIVISTTYLGLQDSASYIFTIQIISILTGVSSAVIGVYVPKMTFLANNPKQQLSLFCYSNLISLMIYILGCLIIVVFGSTMLSIIHAKTTLLTSWQLISLLVIYLLEVQHSNYATMITTDNKVPFVGAAIYSGIGVVILTILLMKFTVLGLWGLIIGQGVVQLAYNNWYWVYYICKKHKVNYFETIKIGYNYFIRHVNKEHFV